MFARLSIDQSIIATVDCSPVHEMMIAVFFIYEVNERYAVDGQWTDLVDLTTRQSNGR